MGEDVCVACWNQGNIFGCIWKLDCVFFTADQALLEAYSAAGGMGFGWWLVEHYLPYHVDCPDGCGLGETAGGG